MDKIFLKIRMPFWAWKEGGRRDNIKLKHEYGAGRISLTVHVSVVRL